MLDNVYVDRTALRRFRSCVLADHLDGYGVWLAESGYPRSTIRSKIGVLGRLARWMAQSGLAVEDLDEARARAFLEARRRLGLRSRHVEHGVLQFIEHLRSGGAVPRPRSARDDTPTAVVLSSYEQYLRDERGLASSTIAAYCRVVGPFVAESAEGSTRETVAPSADHVRAFLLSATREVPPRRGQAIVAALRSFLRFLFLRGHTAVDLSRAVPTVRQGRVATVQRHVTTQEVERVLRGCDLSSSTGRRDHAILLLLARLGLRASEVAALDLNDVHWREGEIVVRGKGLVRERMPMLPDVGAAIAHYLEQDRPSAACRRLFLCRKAPLRGFSHPSSITTLVTRAFARAGVQSVARGAHALRHGLAMTMLRSGASLAQIGEVLRHRSPATTEIYARLDFGALRDVALPWPVPGGAR